MSSLPSGTVALLFTDIEGSTRLLQRLGDQYVLLLTECRALLRDAFRQWHGHEVDTQGDSFFVAFTDTNNAVSAAVTAQRLLHTHTWPDGVAVRVRMGIHTGEPVLISEGYVGIDIHRAARVMNAAHGGQVLLSQRSRDEVEPMLPSLVSLQDLGEYYLKDLLRPEHLFQLVIQDLPADFPPLRSLSPSSATSTIVPKPVERAYALSWSPDRRYIASSGQDHSVKVWKSTTRLIATIYAGHTSTVTTLAWSSDGRYIASASLDQTIHVWSALPNEGLAVERKLSAYDGHSGMITALAWSPNARYVASTTGGGVNTTVHVWDSQTGRIVFIYKGHAYWVRALTWSPDSKFIASGSLNEIHVWESTTGHKVFSYHGHHGWVRAIQWPRRTSSPFYVQDTHIASAAEDKTVQLWIPHKNHPLIVYRGHSDWINSVEWSPDAHYIASVGKDNTVRVWDAATAATCWTFHWHQDSTHAVVWLPDGKHLASVSSDGSVQVWKSL